MENCGIGTREYYEFYYSSRDWRFYKGLLSIITQYSEPGPILDVGAGTGFLVEGGIRWGLPIKGIEGSEDAVRIAHERFPEIDLTQHFLSERLPFNDDTFQTVIMNQVIEHLEPRVAETCLEEIYRVLVSGGMLYIASPSRHNRYERNADPTHINMYTCKELEMLLSSKKYSDITSMNHPQNFLGNTLIGRGLMYCLFRLVSWDRLSASANCIAYKKSVSLEKG